MIAWPTVKPVLDALFARLSGVPADAVRARDAGAGEFTFPADSDAGNDDTDGEGGPLSLTFHLVKVTTLGRDGYETAYDEDAPIEGDTSGEGGAAVNGGVVYTVTGPRIVHIEATLETWHQGIPAHDYMRRFRDRLPLPSARAELATVNLAINEVSPIRDASYEDEEGRAVSVYSFELWLNAFSSESDDPITTIDRVNSTIEEPA
jgi:hypothetical protein